MSANIILQTVIIHLCLKYDSVQFWTLCGKFKGHGHGQPFSQTFANDIFAIIPTHVAIPNCSRGFTFQQCNIQRLWFQ